MKLFSIEIHISLFTWTFRLLWLNTESKETKILQTSRTSDLTPLPHVMMNIVLWSIKVFKSFLLKTAVQILIRNTSRAKSHYCRTVQCLTLTLLTMAPEINLKKEISRENSGSQGAIPTLSWVPNMSNILEMFRYTEKYVSAMYNKVQWTLLNSCFDFLVFFVFLVFVFFLNSSCRSAIYYWYIDNAIWS